MASDPDVTVLGDAVCVEASENEELRYVSDLSTPEPSTILVERKLKRRTQLYEVWATRVQGGPFRGRVADIPDDMVYVRCENRTEYGQGDAKKIWDHLDYFTESTFSDWTTVETDGSDPE